MSLGNGYIITTSSEIINELLIINLEGEIIKKLNFNREVNYINLAGNKMAVAFNEENSAIQIYEWDESKLKVEKIIFESIPTSYPRSIKIDGNLIFISDTFKK